MYIIKNLTEKSLKKELLEEFLEFANKQLDIDKPYSVYFVEDKHNAADALGRTAMYNPSTNSVYVYVTNRHPKDILRSIAHELVHHKQHCNGDLEKMSLEDAEIDANAGGYLLRQFEDGRKETPDSSLNEISAEDFAARAAEKSKQILKKPVPSRLYTGLYKKWKKGEMPFLKDEKSFNKWALEIGVPSVQAQLRAKEMERAGEAMAWAQILDVVGVIPGVGEFADVTSAIIKYNYAQMIEKRDGFDKALIYYIDAAISLAAATVAGEVLKIMASGLALIGRKGVQGGVWALSKARGVPPELIIQDLKDGLKTIGQKVGNRFSKSKFAASRLAKELDVAAARLKQTRIAKNALGKLSAKDIEKMSAKEFIEFMATNPMTRNRFKQAVSRSLTASPELAEVLFKRRLKYFYDMPNTKNNLMSSAFAKEVLEVLNIPLEEITKLLSQVTEKEADNIYAFLDFLLVANKKGVVGVSELVSEFGSKMLGAKSGSEVADAALDIYSREFSNVFESLVRVPGKAQDIFNRMLIGGGFKDLFEEALKKALKEADELLLKIENGSLKLTDKAFAQQMNRLSPEYIIAQLFRPKSKLTQGMQETAVEYILDLTTKKKGLIELENLMFSMFPKIKAFVTKTAPALGAFISKNFLGRRYLTDGLPVNYGGKVIGGTVAKFLEATSHAPVVGWIFRPFRYRSARQAIEAAVGATIASAITYNRFFKVLYPEIPGGGGTEGVGDEAPISAGQQAAADEAREGIENSIEYIDNQGRKWRTTPVDPASFQPSNIEEEVEKVEKEVKESDLPPQVKAKVGETLDEIKKNPKALRSITRKKKRQANRNKRNVEARAPKAAAPKGMPDAKGKGLKNVEATADKGKGVPGVGKGEGEGIGTGVGKGVGAGTAEEVLTRSNIIKYVNQRLGTSGDDGTYASTTDADLVKPHPKDSQMPRDVGDLLIRAVRKYRRKYKSTAGPYEVIQFSFDAGDKDFKLSDKGVQSAKDYKDFKRYLMRLAVDLEKAEKLFESVEKYREKVLNERLQKLTIGLTK